MNSLRRLAALALLTAVTGACGTHEATPAFRRTIAFDDRGISVPLPPPSLVDEPEQEVELRGTTVGADAIVAGTKVHVDDLDGEATGELVLAAGAAEFKVEGLYVDLRAHCFEVWLESPDGRLTDPSLVRAHITGPETLETTRGCDDRRGHASAAPPEAAIPAD
ncbi:MAG: hypothetical protein IAG13_07925 [Deltaproteobacteria bacterium]|nr:hypothetical protein [Nannocystaceae bacterium]